MNSEQLRIRPMTTDDIDAVLAIEEIAYPTPWTRQGYEKEIRRNELAMYHVLEEPSLPSSLSHREEGGKRASIDSRSNSEPLSSERQKEIVGYAGHWMMAGEMHISMIAVHPDVQGQGLGELLLVHQLVQACEKEAILVTLEVRELNTRAQRLYQKLGFVEVGRRKNYYKDTKEAAILMTLEPLDEVAIQQRWNRFNIVY